MSINVLLSDWCSFQENLQLVNNFNGNLVHAFFSNMQVSEWSIFNHKNTFVKSPSFNHNSFRFFKHFHQSFSSFGFSLQRRSFFVSKYSFTLNNDFNLFVRFISENTSMNNGCLPSRDKWFFGNSKSRDLLRWNSLSKPTLQLKLCSRSQILCQKS